MISYILGCKYGGRVYSYIYLAAGHIAENWRPNDGFAKESSEE